MNLYDKAIGREELFSKDLEDLMQHWGLKAITTAIYIQYAIARYNYLRKRIGAEKKITLLGEIIEEILEYPLDRKERKNFNGYLKQIRKIKIICNATTSIVASFFA